MLLFPCEQFVLKLGFFLILEDKGNTGEVLTNKVKRTEQFQLKIKLEDQQRREKIFIL